MIDQAYEQGCEVALQELAEAFGEDVVGELVKIARSQEMSGKELAGLGAGAALGGAGAGYGGYQLGKHLTKEAPEWLNKRMGKYEKGLMKERGVKGKSGSAFKKINTAVKARRRLWQKGIKGVGKWPLGAAAGLGGAALTGYAGKKLMED